MDIRTALAQGTELLAKADVAAPRLNAEVLLGHAMNRAREYFYAHPEQELREVEWLHYGRYLHQRMQGVPTQYITHNQEFFGLDIRVTPDVLIPRPETELLVKTVARMRPRRRLTIDVGTGSGAIALALGATFATDISAKALHVASANALAHRIDVHFVQADLLEPFADAIADVVVSNPPYVSLTDRESLQREVRDHEPHLALFAGDDGLAIYRRLIPQAHRVLEPGGLLALELGFGQAEAVAGLATHWRNRQLYPDLAGIPRVLVCEKP